MATKKANLKVLQQVDQLKARAKSVNDNAIEATDNLVDLSLKAGKQWQGLFARVLKSSTDLLSKQQDIMFDTLEELKDHYQYSAKRVSKLIDIEMPVKPLETPLIAKIKARKEAIKTTRKSNSRKAKVSTVARKTKATAKSDKVTNDLRIIEGIGPKIESLFHEAGIRSFEKLASANLKTLRSVLEQAGPRYRSHDPATWRKQAQLAAKGQMTQLKKLQATLKGGRKAKK